MTSIYDPVESDLEAFQNRYIMSPELWEKFTLKGLKNVDFTKWKSIKLMNTNGDAFSNSLDLIPTEYGGIYVYTINPEVLPACGSYIMYIGMATKTSSENLRYRVKSYQREIGTNYTRERLHRLFLKWGKYIYVYFLPINSDKKNIMELESRLIGALIPPCNADIQAKSVKQAVKAFR